MDTFEAINQRRSVKAYDPAHQLTKAEETKLLEAAIDEHLRLEESVEDLPLEKFVRQLAAEALDAAVLPRRPGLDMERFHADASKPILGSLRRELAAVVAADVLRDASTQEEVAEPFEHVLARETPGDIDCKALSRVRVHERQPPESTTFRRAVHHEVVAQDVVSMLWPQPDGRAIVVVVWHGLL